MRLLPKVLLLAIIGVLSLVIMILMSQYEIIPQTYKAEVDLTFTPASLNTEQREWYERLWAAIEGDTYPNMDAAAASNDTYFIGRSMQPYIMALYTAFRTTGDARLLDEMDRVMEIARAQLSDTNGDGYLNWMWQFDPESHQYGTDDHDLDDILAHNTVAFFAYTMRSNQDLNPVYRERADFWQDYLVNHFLAKWRSRTNGVLRLEKTLTHAYAHLMTMYYYTYRLTGNSDYLEEAEKRAGVLNHMMEDDGNALTWDHRVPVRGEMPLGCQTLQYARYTLSAFQQMHYEGFSYYADPAYMARYATTIRDNILQEDGSVVAEDVCGSVGDTHASMDYTLSLLTCYARWDETGTIAAESTLVYTLNEPVSDNTVFVPACMVSVLANN